MRDEIAIENHNFRLVVVLKYERVSMINREQKWHHQSHK